MLVNGKNTVQVNALLDDGSSQTYVNKAVAAELGVQAETKSITVNILTGMTKTFASMPVEVELRSVGGDFTTSLHAMTTSHVMGDLRVIDWSNKRKNWRHLSSIEFRSSREPEDARGSSHRTRSYGTPLVAGGNSRPSWRTNRSADTSWMDLRWTSGLEQPDTSPIHRLRAVVLRPERRQRADGRGEEVLVA